MNDQKMLSGERVRLPPTDLREALQDNVIAAFFSTLTRIALLRMSIKSSRPPQAESKVS